MKPEDILRYCLETLEGTVRAESWGESGIFYNPGGTLKRGVYVLTVKEKDGANDKSSRLDRPGVYRVNLGLRKKTYARLFGPLPARPPKGGVVSAEADFTAPDRLVPHPVYAWMGWAAVLNPSPGTFEAMKPLIQESYEYAREILLVYAMVSALGS